MAMKHSPKLPAIEESPRELSTLEVGDEWTFDGKPCRITHTARGPYIRSDGKGAYEGIGFIGIVPCEK